MNSGYLSRSGEDCGSLVSVGIGTRRFRLGFTRAAAAALIEPSQVSQHLFKERQFAPRRRGRARYRLDVPTVLQFLAIDTRHNAIAVEPDDIDLLIQHFGAEKRELLRLAADVEPVLVIEC